MSANRKECPKCGKLVRFIPALDYLNASQGLGYYQIHDCEIGAVGETDTVRAEER